jgi:hypothetical protein
MKKVRLFLCLAGLCYFAAGYGQNEKFKALFIYNFTNYIEWPGGTSATFIITVVGESPIINELQSISKLKKVGSATIEVKKVNSASEIGTTQIVYIPADKKRVLPEIAQAMSGKATLIISDNAQGKFGINFVEVDSKQSFQISKSNIEDHRLKVNSSLLSLGTSVN